MALLDQEIADQVKQELADLAGPVRLVMFTQDFECRYCAETRQLVEEVAELSDHLTAEIHDFVADEEKAEELGVDKIPAIAVIGAQDYGVRFYGIPSGYEFASFLKAMVRADMVEAMEFPHLAIKYEVMGVPRTVINEKVHIEGAAPEPMVLEKLQEALAGEEK
jgi:predicted DsbA family dithiol-disulfide isomerase